MSRQSHAKLHNVFRLWIQMRLRQFGADGLAQDRTAERAREHNRITAMELIAASFL